MLQLLCWQQTRHVYESRNWNSWHSSYSLCSSGVSGASGLQGLKPQPFTTVMLPYAENKINNYMGNTKKQVCFLSSVRLLQCIFVYGGFSLIWTDLHGHLKTMLYALIICREREDIGLFITLVPKVQKYCFLIRWLSNLWDSS